MSASATTKWTIPCLNCDGKGWVVRWSMDGLKRPVKCRGCGGTGSQKVT